MNTPVPNLLGFQELPQFNPGYGWGDAVLMFVGVILCVIAFSTIVKIGFANSAKVASQEQAERNAQQAEADDRAVVWNDTRYYLAAKKLREGQRRTLLAIRGKAGD